MLFAGSFREFREFPGLYDSSVITINYREFYEVSECFPHHPHHLASECGQCAHALLHFPKELSVIILSEAAIGHII